MIHEILLKFGLTEPNIYDIMDKLVRNVLTIQELLDLKEHGPIYKFIDSRDLYSIKISVNNKACIEFRRSNSCSYWVPTCQELNSNIKYVNEMLNDIKERLLISKINRDNECKNKHNEYVQKEICCRNKLWKKLNE